MNSQLANKIIQIFVKHFDKDANLVIESKTFECLSLDELDKIEAIMRMEDEFSIEISDEEADNFNSVNDIIKCIENKLS